MTERFKGSKWAATEGEAKAIHETSEVAKQYHEDDLEAGLREWDAEIRAETEPLTGLMRREVFEGALEHMLHMIRTNVVGRRSRPSSKVRAGGLEQIALIYIDLDHFKQVNDTFGHAAGDEVLQKVGALLKGSIRDTDIAARIGGEELALILRGSALDDARRHAEQILQDVRALEFDTFPELQVTASAGVASSKDALASDELRKHADLALYSAKHTGRDRVEVYGGDKTSNV